MILSKSKSNARKYSIDIRYITHFRSREMTDGFYHADNKITSWGEL